jgi:hypothetical protein
VVRESMTGEAAEADLLASLNEMISGKDMFGRRVSSRSSHSHRSSQRSHPSSRGSNDSAPAAANATSEPSPTAEAMPDNDIDSDDDGDGDDDGEAFPDLVEVAIQNAMSLTPQERLRLEKRRLKVRGARFFFSFFFLSFFCPFFFVSFFCRGSSLSKNGTMV